MTAQRPGRSSVGVIAAAFAAVSCSNTFREGNPSPANAATLESANTVVDEIDGKNVQDIRRWSARYVLPAGPHLIGFSVLKSIPVFGGRRVITSDFRRVCLKALPGRSYTTDADIRYDIWDPLIREKDPHDRSEDNPEGHLVPIDCAHDRLFGTAPSAALPPGGVTSPASGQGGPQEPTAAPPAMPAAEGSSGPAPRPTERASAVREVLHLWARQPITPDNPHPFLDFHLTMGIAFGGDELVNARLSNGDTRTINAGGGWFGNVGAMVTPLWIGEAVGFGAGAEIGFKVDDISAANGSITLTRFPLSATAHVVPRIGERWFVVVAGGITEDLGIDLSGSGDASDVNGRTTSRLGWLGRVTLYDRKSDGAAFVFGMTYTHLRWNALDTTVGANSFGLFIGIDYAAL